MQWSSLGAESHQNGEKSNKKLTKWISQMVLVMAILTSPSYPWRPLYPPLAVCAVMPHWQGPAIVPEGYSQRMLVTTKYILICLLFIPFKLLYQQTLWGHSDPLGMQKNKKTHIFTYISWKNSLNMSLTEFQFHSVGINIL